MGFQPVFLHRNLSYMKGRCSRVNKKHNFKVDSILESKTSKNQTNEAEPRFKFMTLTFLGLFDPKGRYSILCNYYKSEGCLLIFIDIVNQLPNVRSPLVWRPSSLKSVTRKEKMYRLLSCK